PTDAKPLTNTASASSATATDPNAANNTASDSTIVGYGTCTAATFSGPGIFGQYTSLLTTGDFNGDGFVDVAAGQTASSPHPNNVAIFLNVGAGNFSPSPTY